MQKRCGGRAGCGPGTARRARRRTSRGAAFRHLARSAAAAGPAGGPRPRQKDPRAVQADLPRPVMIAKRGFDIAVASVALLLTLPLWPLIALAIWLDSRGPVVFRQLRVGHAAGDRVVLFEMLKFRSMRRDAESATGAVWASKGDPRVTRVGRFLRRTRLDELPQLINVLKGEMSIVGPRPERPGFYGRLENAVPFFADRTAGLRPGITGLAQVHQGYDATIEDVRRKVAWDHAYALRCRSLRGWIATDLDVALRTLAVMAGGHGR